MRSPDTRTSPKTNEDTLQGLFFALMAYGLWGFLPIYMKIMSHIPVVEVLVHRVLWSVPIAAAVLIVLRRTSALNEALRNPRMLVMGCVTAVLISVNWGVYIWAIVTGHALDAIIIAILRRNPAISMGVAALSFANSDDVDFDAAFGIIMGSMVSMEILTPLVVGVIRKKRFGLFCKPKTDVDNDAAAAKEEPLSPLSRALGGNNAGGGATVVNVGSAVTVGAQPEVQEGTQATKEGDLAP